MLPSPFKQMTVNSSQDPAFQSCGNSIASENKNRKLRVELIKNPNEPTNEAWLSLAWLGCNMSHSSCVGRARTSRAAWTPRDKGNCFAVFIPLSVMSNPVFVSIRFCPSERAQSDSAHPLSWHWGLTILLFPSLEGFARRRECSICRSCGTTFKCSKNFGL